MSESEQTRALKKRRRKSPSRRLLRAMMLFYFCAFLLLAFADEQFDARALLLSVIVPALMYLGVIVLPRLFHADRLLLSLTNFLCALGVLIQYRLSPGGGMQQALNYGIGIGVMLACILFIRVTRRGMSVLVTLMAVGSMALLALPLLFGREIGGAKNWISLGGTSFQPSEVVKLTLLYVLAYTFSRRKHMLGIAFALAALAMLMLQKDLGTALLYYAVTVAMLYASTRSLPLAGAALAGGAGAAFIGYRMFAHVKERVRIWLNPSYDPSGAGYQLTQAMIAISNGGLWGVGLGLGNPESVPVIQSDFIFTAIVLELGIVFAVCVIALYAVILWRGAGVALGSRGAFEALLSLGCVCFIALQTFVIIGGNVGLIPLTGVTLPFISSGGTSMITSLGLVGLVQGVSSRNMDALDEDRRLAELGEEET